MLEQALEEANQVWATELLRNGEGFDYVEALQKCLARLQGTHAKYSTCFMPRNIPGPDRRGDEHVRGRDQIAVAPLRTALRQCVQTRLGTVAWAQAPTRAARGPTSRRALHEPRPCQPPARSSFAGSSGRRSPSQHDRPRSRPRRDARPCRRTWWISAGSAIAASLLIAALCCFSGPGNTRTPKSAVSRWKGPACSANAEPPANRRRPGKNRTRRLRGGERRTRDRLHHPRQGAPGAYRWIPGACNSTFPKIAARLMCMSDRWMSMTPGRNFLWMSGSTTP